jgi:hypothetical protein
VTPGGDDAARVTSAVGAARAVAAAHGLRTKPRVLQDGINVVLHLAPAPVVARVATLTRLLRHDGLTPFGREVSLAGALASAGAPVVPPSDLLPPGPHRHGDTVLSFWTYTTVLPERPGPVETAAAFGELHDRLVGLPVAGTPSTPRSGSGELPRRSGPVGRRRRPPRRARPPAGAAPATAGRRGAPAAR